MFTHLRSPTSAARAKLLSLEYQAVARPLLHEVGKVSGEARRMGCGKQECVVDGSRLWSRKSAGFEAAGHTPSGPAGHLVSSECGRFGERAVVRATARRWT